MSSTAGNLYSAIFLINRLQHNRSHDANVCKSCWKYFSLLGSPMILCALPRSFATKAFKLLYCVCCFPSWNNFPAQATDSSAFDVKLAGILLLLKARGELFWSIDYRRCFGKTWQYFDWSLWNPLRNTQQSKLIALHNIMADFPINN